MPRWKDLPVTDYFLQEVLAKRPYLKKKWILEVLESPQEIEPQSDGKLRYWGFVPEQGRFMRVITLADGGTIHNAFFDRGYD